MSTFTRRVVGISIVASLLLMSGCAAMLPRRNPPRKDNNAFQVTEAQVEKAQHEAEADPLLRSVEEYANTTSAYAFNNPSWDSSAHVARIEKLVEECAGQAKDARDRAKLDDIRAAARLAARDFPGAKAIYRKRFDKQFSEQDFGQYLRLLNKLNGVPAVNDECKDFYGRAKEDERRYDIAGQCEKVLQTREDDGLAWLSPDDHVKVREEFVMRSAENQLVGAKMEREQARQDGRYISAYYKGMIDIRIQSDCPRVAYLAISAAARAPITQRIPVESGSTHSVVSLQADHLLWLLDDSSHRIGVARMGMWNNGLLITRSCKTIVPVE